MNGAVKTKVRETLLFQLFAFRLSDRAALRFAQLLGESFLLMTLSLWLPYVMHFEQSAVYSLFVVSFILMERVDFLLAENKHNIWTRKWSGWKSNTLSIGSILAIFSGIFLSSFLFGHALIWLNALQGFKESFAFFLQGMELEPSVDLASRFQGFLPILAHNFKVLVTLSVVTICYRGYGLILVLGWNGCVWGGVFGLLFYHSFAGKGTFGVWVVFQAFIAVLPHLFLEASAYVAGALAALFFSKAVTKYEPGDSRLAQVYRVSLFLLFIAIILLFLGGAAEVSIPPKILPF